MSSNVAVLNKYLKPLLPLLTALNRPLRCLAVYEFVLYVSNRVCAVSMLYSMYFCNRLACLS